MVHGEMRRFCRRFRGPPDSAKIMKLRDRRGQQFLGIRNTGSAHTQASRCGVVNIIISCAYQRWHVPAASCMQSVAKRASLKLLEVSGRREQ